MYLNKRTQERFVVQEEDGDYRTLRDFGSMVRTVFEEQPIGKLVVDQYTSVITKIKKTTDDIQKFPQEIKKRMVPEIDRLIYSVNPRDPSGAYEEVVIIDTFQFPNMSPDQLKQLAVEYSLIDKVFRDLKFANHVKYISMFYKSLSK